MDPDPQHCTKPYMIWSQVIEVMIRHEEGLARDVVKHLQRIEEQILECRAWAASSPLWDAIRSANAPTPAVHTVSGAFLRLNSFFAIELYLYICICLNHLLRSM